MKFNCKRKINISKFYKRIYGKRFDKDLHGFETEDIEVVDGDSFDEAAREADRLIAGREGYWLAKVQAQYEAEYPVAPAPAPVAPAPAPVTTSVAPVAPVPAPVPNATPSIQPAGTSSAPPAEFA